jgi:Omp85 superfamily domain
VRLLVIGSIVAGISFAAPGLGRGQDQAAANAETPDQSDEKAEDDRSWVTRLRAFHGQLLKRGIEPELGVIVPGSGLAIGGNLLIPNFGTLPLGAEVEGRISVRGYRESAVRFGRVVNRRHSAAMHPADSEMGSLFSTTRENKPGLALYVEHHRRHLPSLSLYGQNGEGSLMRADFGRASTTTDAVIHWQATRTFGVGSRVGMLAVELFPGTDGHLDNTETAFVSVGTPAHEHARYVVSAVGVSVDRRDSPTLPTSGFRVDGLVRHFASQTANRSSFMRASVDVRAFRSLSARNVLALQLLGSVTDRGVPFYLMDFIGGGRTMRGYQSYRLRGHRLLTGTIESRWRASNRIEIAPFLDAGFVGGAPLPGTPTSLLVTPGIGLRARTAKRVIFRADAAFGSEGGRVAFGVETPF